MERNDGFRQEERDLIEAGELPDYRDRPKGWAYPTEHEKLKHATTDGHLLNYHIKPILDGYDKEGRAGIPATLFYDNCSPKLAAGYASEKDYRNEKERALKKKAKEEGRAYDPGDYKVEYRKDGKQKGAPRAKKFHEVKSLVFRAGTFRFLPDRQRLECGYKNNPMMTLRLRYKCDRPLPSDPFQVIVKEDSCHKHWVMFTCKGIPVSCLPKTGKTVGIDVGLRNLIADSDGRTIRAPEHNLIKKNGRTIDLEEQMIKMPRESPERKKLQKQADKLQLQANRRERKMINKRTNHHNHVALYYTANYDRISMEGIDVADLKKNKPPEERDETRKREIGRHRAFDNSSLGALRQRISETATKNGRSIVLVNPAYSTQTCSACGNRNDNALKLGEPIFCCEKCGHKEDRDTNAAKNINKWADSPKRQAKKRERTKLLVATRAARKATT
jgi:putative transposase